MWENQPTTTVALFRGSFSGSILVSRGGSILVSGHTRNEPRDFYDLWYLCEQAHVDLVEVIDAIASKLEFRGQSLEKIGAQLDVKQSRLGRLWNQRLAGQMATLPEFDGVFRSVRRAFRQAGIGAG